MTFTILTSGFSWDAEEEMLKHRRIDNVGKDWISLTAKGSAILRAEMINVTK